MKLLLDNGLPRTTVPLLTALQHDAIHVGDVGMSFASDREILERAAVENRIAVTLDADFHTLLALSGARCPSVIRIRIEGLKAADLVVVIERVVAAFANELVTGAAITVESHRARCRRLPIV